MYYCYEIQENKVLKCRMLRNLSRTLEISLESAKKHYSKYNQIINVQFEDNGDIKIDCSESLLNQIKELKEDQENLEKYKERMKVLGIAGLIKFRIIEDGTIELSEVDTAYPYKAITIPDFVQYIGKQAFNLSTIEKIVLRNKEHREMQLAFAFNNMLTERLELIVQHSESIILMNQVFCSCPRMKELKLKNFDWSNIKSLYRTFYDCTALTRLDLGKIETMHITDLQQAFSLCRSLKNVDFLYKMDLSKVEDATEAFYQCSQLEKIDLSKLSLDSLKTTKSMFRNCSRLEEYQTGNIKAPKLACATSMFSMTAIKKFDMTHLGNEIQRIDRLLEYCLDLEHINFDYADLQNITSLERIVKGCEKLREIDLQKCKFNTIKNISEAFSGCENLKEIKFPDDCRVFSMVNKADYAFARQGLECLDLQKFRFKGKSINLEYMLHKCKDLKTAKFPKMNNKVHEYYDMLQTETDTTIDMSETTYEEFKSCFEIPEDTVEMGRIGLKYQIKIIFKNYKIQYIRKQDQIFSEITLENNVRQ